MPCGCGARHGNKRGNLFSANESNLLGMQAAGNGSAVKEAVMQAFRILFTCVWLAVAAGAYADSTVEVFLNSS